MKKNKGKKLILLVYCFVFLTGCFKHQQMPVSDGQKIYFFDQTRGELVSEPIGEEFELLKTPREQVDYITGRLMENKSTQLAALQNSTPMPSFIVHMEEDLEEDATVKVHFSMAYNDLTPTEKIGMRASIVYSLCELNFISGVDFYVEDIPLITATGTAVGTVSASLIKLGVLDPNPATKPYTLSLYFLNDEGKLDKVVQTIDVGGTAVIEKLLIEELIKGPNAEGLHPTLPSDVKINEVKVTAGTCYIDLSFDTKSKFFASDEQKEIMIYSIVNSLTELQQVKKVVIYLDGQRGSVFTPNIEFGDTLERSEAYISDTK